MDKQTVNEDFVSLSFFNITQAAITEILVYQTTKIEALENKVIQLEKQLSEILMVNNRLKAN